MLEYNTKRNQMMIREYGRNVQKMIEYALTVKDQKKRTENAKAIVRIMSQVNPDSKDNLNNVNLNSPQKKKISDSVDYWHKLWDHLYIISNYKLDVDYPFSKVEPNTEKLKPILPDYNKTKIKYRTYGRNIENIIKKVSELPDDEREKMTKMLANYLKKLYLTYNRDSVDDSLIIAQLEELSDGKLQLPEDFTMESTKMLLMQNLSQPNNNESSLVLNKKKKNNRNNRNNRKRK